MAKAADERKAIRESMAALKGQADSDAVICLAYYSGLSHSVDYSAIQQSYRDSGILSEYERLGLDTSGLVPRENNHYDEVKYGLMEFVNGFNRDAIASGSSTRMKHIHIGTKPLPHDPSVTAKVKGIVTYEKDSNMSPHQVNTIWCGDDGSLSFSESAYEQEVRDCIREQAGKVNPQNWRQSMRDFLERHGGLRQTADGAGSGNRWMPVQTSKLLDMMDEAVSPHGGRLTWFGIPSNTSERHKEGIIDSLMTDIEERLESVAERLDRYAEKINSGETTKGSAILTAKEDAATVREIMALHGANFGLDFVDIRQTAKSLIERAEDLHSAAVSKSKAEVAEAKKKVEKSKGDSAIQINLKKEEPDDFAIDWSLSEGEENDDTDLIQW